MASLSSTPVYENPRNMKFGPVDPMSNIQEREHERHTQRAEHERRSAVQSAHHIDAYSQAPNVGHHSQLQGLHLPPYNSASHSISNQRKEVRGTHVVRGPNGITMDANTIGEMVLELSVIQESRRLQMNNLLTDMKNEEYRTTSLFADLRYYYEAREKQFHAASQHQRNDIEALVHERDQLRDLNTRFESEILGLRQQLANDSQRTPIVAASSFSLHTADGASGADIIRDVQLLNDEIYQFAAGLAEECDDNSSVGRARRPIMNEQTMEDVTCRFGQQIAKVIWEAKARPEYSCIVQALQACIVSCCEDVLRSWHPFRTKSDSIGNVYRAIGEAEGQGVSGQWRSLMYRHACQDKANQEDVITPFRERIISVLKVLGQLKLNAVQDEALVTLILSVLHIHEIIRRDIVSGDIEIISAAPGTHFDPDTMELNAGRNSPTKSASFGRIRCTTDMGLRKCTLEKFYSEGKWMLRNQTSVILKAKVVLADHRAERGVRPASRLVNN
ncbi:hypothetical protein AX17_002440 [Amanita inopinata Kibby_2008]|nr:hypothetical protein AX17_002440 [Amanita inopinata Kibby_2008]